MRAYKFRAYPTPTMDKVLQDTFFSCFKLYNTALEQRREGYRMAHKYISYQVQQNELPLLKKEFPEYTEIHSQVLQNVLKRVDLAFKGFFQRIKERNGRAGFPRYKSLNRYDSICYTQSGFRIIDNHVKFSKIGDIRIKFHRSIPDSCKMKTCTIKREGSKWYVIFTCETLVITQKKVVSSAVGIDLGITDFAVLSNGEAVTNPKYLKKSEDKLKSLQTKYSTGKSKKVRRQLGSLHYKVANQRKDFQHKLSRKLIDTFDLIAYEDLKVKQMIEDNKYHLQKYISDAGWGQFINMLVYKAEDAGKYAIAVNPRGTTQKCSRCGKVVHKSLNERSHKCPFCSFETTRDHNAALNIHKLGISLVDNHNFLSSKAPSPLGKG